MKDQAKFFDNMTRQSVTSVQELYSSNVNKFDPYDNSDRKSVKELAMMFSTPKVIDYQSLGKASVGKVSFIKDEEKQLSDGSSVKELALMFEQNKT